MGKEDLTGAGVVGAGVVVVVGAGVGGESAGGSGVVAVPRTQWKRRRRPNRIFIMLMCQG